MILMGAWGDRLPGSQNGEESSGHLTESPAWFGNTVNQGRSDATVAAVIAWLETNPYRSVVSGIEGEYLPVLARAS